MSEAIGMIETKGYTGSIEATDAMAKAANVTIAKTIAIGGGLITVICRGDVARGKGGEHLFLVDEKAEHYVPTAGRVGLRFFGDVILDCLQRTERAMTQAHTFKAAELCLRAQAAARRLT